MDPQDVSANEPAEPEKKLSLGELITKVAEQVSSLIRDELEYNLAKLKAKAAKVGAGSALVLAGALIAVMASVLLILAGVSALALVVPWWAAFLIVAGALLAITALLVYIGIRLCKESSSDVIDPQVGLAKDVDAMKKGLTK